MPNITRAAFPKIAALLALVLAAATITIGLTRDAVAAGSSAQIRFSTASKGVLAFAMAEQCTEDSCTVIYVNAGENMTRSTDTHPLKGTSVCLDIYTYSATRYSGMSGCNTADKMFSSSANGANVAPITVDLVGGYCDVVDGNVTGCYAEDPRTVTLNATWTATGPFGHYGESETESWSRCKWSEESDQDGRSASAVISVDGVTYNAPIGSADVGKGTYQRVFQCQ